MINKIVVEGPNNVGKTSLVNRLMNVHGLNTWKVIHMTGNDDNSFKHYDELFGTDENIIFDRAHVGEMIYPKIYGRKSTLTEKEFLELCRKYKDKILYIFVNANINFVIKANANKNERFNQSEFLTEQFEFLQYSQKIEDITCSILKIYNK